MIKDYVFLDKKTAVQNLTVHLNNILKSNKKVNKDEVIQHLEEYKNIDDASVKNMISLLNQKKVKVDKSTIMMIIDVCNDLVKNNTAYVLSRSTILNTLPKQFVLETRNLLLYLYQVRIELMANKKIDKNQFIKDMSKFENVSDMIINMVKTLENRKMKTVSTEIILNLLDIVNDSVGIKTRFLINASN